MKEPFIYPLKHPTLLLSQTLNELRFPAMKGKYMRKFTMTVQREELEARRVASGEASAELGMNRAMGATWCWPRPC